MLKQILWRKTKRRAFLKKNAPAFRANQSNKNCFADLYNKSHATEKLKGELKDAL